MSAKPHPQNVEGSFYVEDGCCLTCGVPLDEAPSLFEWADDGASCVVRRQPGSPEEVSQVLHAMEGAEVDCIRYRGDDPGVARRMAEMGHADLCDLPPPPDARELSRDHVTFRARGLSPAALVGRLAAFLEQGNDERFSPYEIEPSPGAGRLQFSWFEHALHTVEFDRGEGPGRWLARCVPCRPAAMRGVARTVEQWLSGDELVGEVRWYSADQWRSGGPWTATRL